MGIIKTIRKDTYPFYFKIIGALYQIKLVDNIEEEVKWCREKFGNQGWTEIWRNRWDSSNDRWAAVNNGSQHIFAFVNESDYTEFCLRWL